MNKIQHKALKALGITAWQLRPDWVQTRTAAMGLGQASETTQITAPPTPEETDQPESPVSTLQATLQTLEKQASQALPQRSITTAEPSKEQIRLLKPNAERSSTDDRSLEKSRPTSWEALDLSFVGRSHCNAQSKLNSLPNPQSRTAKIALLVGPPSEADLLQQSSISGSAAQLLSDLLLAVGIPESQLYVSSCLKCSPQQQAPRSGQEEPCSVWIHQELALLNPQVSLILGEQAARVVLKTNATLASLRAEPQKHPFSGFPCVVTHSLGDLLRNSQLKRECWSDLKRFRALIA